MLTGTGGARRSCTESRPEPGQDLVDGRVGGAVQPLHGAGSVGTGRLLLNAEGPLRENPAARLGQRGAQLDDAAAGRGRVEHLAELLQCHLQPVAGVRVEARQSEPCVDCGSSFAQTQRDQLGRRGNPPAQGVELWTGCAQVVERGRRALGPATSWERSPVGLRWAHRGAHPSGSLQGRSEVIGLDAGRLRRRATSEQRREDDSGPLPHRCARPRLAALALARVSPVGRETPSQAAPRPGMPWSPDSSWPPHARSLLPRLCYLPIARPAIPLPADTLRSHSPARDFSP